MREVNIDLENISESYECGFIGEANAAKLLVDVSSIAEQGVSFYALKFKNTYGDVYCSERIFANEVNDNVISFEIYQELTSKPALTLVVEAYNLENDEISMIKKSGEVILTFNGSILEDGIICSDEINGILKELSETKNEFNSQMESINDSINSIVDEKIELNKKEYRLIKDLTLTESTFTIKVDADENGNPFNLTDVKYFLDIENTSGQTHLRCLVNDLDDELCRILFGVPSVGKVSKLLTDIHCFGFTTQDTIGTINATDILDMSLTGTRFSGINFNVRSISSISFKGTGPQTFGANTRLIIYGIDAEDSNE